MKLFFKGEPLRPADTRALAIAATTGGNGDNNQNGGGSGKNLLIVFILLAAVAGGIWFFSQPSNPTAGKTIAELYRSAPLMDSHGNPIPWETIEEKLRQEFPSCRTTTPGQEEVLRRIQTKTTEDADEARLGQLNNEFNELMLQLARVANGPHDCCDIAKLLDSVVTSY